METKQKNSLKCILGISIMLIGTVILLSKFLSYSVLAAISFVLMIVVSARILEEKNDQTVLQITRYVSMSTVVFIGLFLTAYIVDKDMNDRFSFHLTFANMIQSEKDKLEIERIRKDKIIYEKLLANKLISERGNSKKQLLVNKKHSDYQINSSLIKKVNGKYRYYFNIRNVSKEQLESQIKIVLQSQNGESNREEVFKEGSFHPTKKMVFVEINSGTVDSHGEYGISHYNYEIIRNNKVIESGVGDITSNFRDME